MVEYVTPVTRVSRFDSGRNTGALTTSRLCAGRVKQRPLANSKGSVVTFPDGSTFRKHTAHAVSEAWYEDGGSASSSAKIINPPWTGNNAFWMSGPGGSSDHFLNYAKNSALKGIDVANTRLPPSIPTGRRNEVVTKALLELADSSVNLGEGLATLGQTFRMLRDPFVTLVKGLREVASDRKLEPFILKSLRDIQREGIGNAAARKYLEYVYGWRPLMQDIHDLIARGKEKAQAPLLLSASTSTERGGAGPSFSYEDYSTKEVSRYSTVNFSDRVNCTLVARVDPEYAGVRALNQLGLVNPLSLAWELVPFSFVIDWVLPIGSVLQSYTAPAGLKFVTGSVSRRVKASAQYESTTNIFNQVYPAYMGVKTQAGGGTFRYEGYAREIFGAWPTTGLWIDIDPLRRDRGYKAAALTLIALGGQHGKQTRTARIPTRVSRSRWKY